MKDDLAKLLCERPRKGAGTSSYRSIRKRAKRDFDMNPPSGMRKVHTAYRVGGERKELNEFLNPLYRYLNKQAGRKWNDVYSEIRAVINTNSAVQMHIMQHLWWVVHKDVVMINGVPHHPTYGWALERTRGSYREMYIDPRNGILKMCPMPKPSKYNRHYYGYGRLTEIKTVPSKVKDVHYCEHNGIWYEVTFKNFKEVEPTWGRNNTPNEVRFDFLVKDYLDRWKFAQRYKGIGVPVAKRQLNGDEIRKLELRKKSA